MPTSSQQTSQSVTDEPSQVQITNETVHQTAEIVGTELLATVPADTLSPVAQSTQTDSIVSQTPVTQENQSTTLDQEKANSVQPLSEAKVSEPSIATESPQTVVANPSQSAVEPATTAQLAETSAVESAPTDQLAKEVVQPVLRSVSMARSVVANEVAKLPLDDQGELMTSVNGKTVQQFQVVYSDGSSQIVPATTQPTTSQTREAVARGCFTEK